MREFVATLTQRGQVTVPAEVRRALGLQPRGKVVFRFEDGEVRLSPPKFTLESTFGSVPPLNRPEDFNEVIRQAKEERAERLLRKMGVL